VKATVCVLTAPVRMGGASEQGTTITAVHDGYALTKSTMRTPLGGELLSEVMLHSVEASGATVKPRYAFKRKSVGADNWDVTPVTCPNTSASYTQCVCPSERRSQPVKQ
jgi:hypothetical protein